MAGKKLDINSTVKLPSGYEMPLLGYGVYQTPADACTSVVSHALKTGYRHVDSAAAYRNEAECAKALLSSDLPRSSYFFTSKVPPKEISYDGAKKTVENTLKVCDGIEYIDLMLLHAPFGGKDNRLGAYDALVEAVKSSKVRSIGVSNYGTHHLQELSDHIKSKYPNDPSAVCSINQVELHPFMPRRDIVKWCNDHNVILQAWGPLVRAQKWDDPRLKSVVDKHGKTTAQVLVRWSLQKGFVPLPKSVNEKRIEENADVYSFELDKEDMGKLETDEYYISGWDPTTSKD